VVVVEVRNADLVETVAKEAKRLEITNGTIVSLIGSVDSFTISTMSKDDATKDIITNYTVPAEMTGTGEITDGTVHIHAVMAIEVIKQSPGTSTRRQSERFLPALTSSPADSRLADEGW
jgi:predicted DNA-binding protein with PD1-like motif